MSEEHIYQPLKFHECPHCHYRTPISNNDIDWQSAYQFQKEITIKLVESFNKMIDEMQEQFQVPLREYLNVDRMLIINELKKLVR